jgi:hypothetical protein
VQIFPLLKWLALEEKNTMVVAACYIVNQKTPPLAIFEGKIYGTIGLPLKTLSCNSLFSKQNRIGWFNHFSKFHLLTWKAYYLWQSRHTCSQKLTYLHNKPSSAFQPTCYNHTIRQFLNHWRQHAIPRW